MREKNRKKKEYVNNRIHQQKERIMNKYSNQLVMIVGQDNKQFIEDNFSDLLGNNHPKPMPSYRYCLLHLPQSDL